MAVAEPDFDTPVEVELPPLGSQPLGSGPLGSGPLASRRVLGMRVDATSYDDIVERVIAWARNGEARAVGVATVNNVMESHDDEGFLRVMNALDVNTPDGMPLVWGLRWLGVRDATRVYGPAMTPLVLERAAREGIPVGFYGGSEQVLAELRDHATSTYPGIRIAFSESPPFRALTDDEERATAAAIAASGAKIVFVGLGCPKQERWMERNRHRVPAVTLGVGAAFDFLTGRKRQAPPLLQRAGLEWLFRLVTEPRRLWRRYLRHNPRFIVLFARQLLRERDRGTGSDSTNGGST